MLALLSNTPRCTTVGSGTDNKHFICQSVKNDNRHRKLWLALLFPIQEILCLNLGLEADYLDKDFREFSHSLQENCWDSALKYATAASFQALSHSRFTSILLFVRIEAKQ
jgi:hypothetical protein